MAYGKKGKSKRTSVRLTGLFKTKKRGMYVGSVSELDDMVAKVKAAMKDEKGVVFFLFKNDEEDGPLFTLYMDVAQDEGARRPKRKPIEDDDDEPEEKDDDDEVPF